MPDQELEQRFQDKIQKGCWLWTGAVRSSGYGNIKVGKATWSAHRLAWLFHRGDIPAGMLVLHKCDVKLCVNPDHLFLGTQADNMRDASKKRRLVRGERHGAARISEKTAREIKKRLSAGTGIADIAKEMRVSLSIVRHIHRGEAWAWL